MTTPAGRAHVAARALRDLGITAKANGSKVEITAKAAEVLVRRERPEFELPGLDEEDS